MAKKVSSTHIVIAYEKGRQAGKAELLAELRRDRGPDYLLGYSAGYSAASRKKPNGHKVSYRTGYDDGCAVGYESALNDLEIITD